MFAGISRHYDCANHCLSVGVDYLWRARLVRAARRRHATEIVDLATGSGDVAFALRQGLGPAAAITGLDFCQPMLDVAKAKQDRRPPSSRIQFLQGDILQLPFADSTFDLATIAFGLRNLENRTRGLQEIHRILKPSGALLCLEFTQPERWFRPLYYFYLRRILPGLAAWITRNKEAYLYLGDSISAFPAKEQLSQELRQAGFASVTATGLTFSIVALHEAVKSGPS